jgi:hypothetical protein
MASYLEFALSSSSTHEVIMSLSFVMELRQVATEIFEGAMVVETVLEKVDDLLVGNIDYGSALVEKASHVLA